MKLQLINSPNKENIKTIYLYLSYHLKRSSLLFTLFALFCLFIADYKQLKDRQNWIKLNY